MIQLEGKSRTLIRRRSTATSLLGLVLVACWLVAVPATADQVTRYEDLPAQPSFPFIVDAWTFYCPANGSATVSVDTVGLASGSNVPLDPAFELYSPSGTFIGMGDDEMSCTAANVCGFDCAQLTVDCLEGGEQTLLVLTATSAGCGEDRGPYELTVEVFDGLGGSGTPLSEDDTALGGEGLNRGFPWGYYPPGPALDDRSHGFFLPIFGPEALERAQRLRNKKRDRD